MKGQRYQFLQSIALTTYGNVGLYKDQKRKTLVAIKTINLCAANQSMTFRQMTPTSNNAFVEYLFFRLMSQRKHKHRNVGRLRNDFSDSDNFYLVLDYCSNGNLKDLIMNSDTLLPLPTVQTYFKQIVNGLHHLHADGYAHRDLTLSSILINNEDECQLCSFGNVCIFDEVGGVVKGDLNFQAPEATKNIAHNPKEADMWSLGVILFIMLTGLRPLNVANESDYCFRLINTQGIAGLLKLWKLDLPLEAVDILQNLLVVNPEERMSIEKLQMNPWIASGKRNFFWSLLNISVKQNIILKYMSVDFCIIRAKESDKYG